MVTADSEIYVKDDGPIGDWRGYRGVYGTEILSARHRKLELDDMANLFDSTMAQFAKF
ncbi:hypothetical protein [Bradyrhizobium sp. RDM4]|uniref:hypothetical protein n=1 Tax=Bradyrhizobium sp. RDM4 TaxID=3378765 RepID=UPI0038FBF4B2